jgi:serine/threonine-protein kinase
MPDAGYRTLLAGEAELWLILGCPTEFHPRVTPQAWELETAYQAFEGGEMIWTSRQVGWYGPPFIHILYADGSYQSLPDTFDPAVDPIKGGEMPPEGRVEPVYGFGKIWREQPEVRQKLGWAKAEEVAGIGASQQFVGGHLLWINQTNRTYAFVKDGNIRSLEVPYSK